MKAPGQERFVRTKTLGEEYTEDSLNIRITYRDMGTGVTPAQDEQSKLSRAYAAILHDIRVLAAQHKKAPRKRIVTAEYSVDNDLDVYRLSAQLSVISQNNISSIGELEGRISRLKEEYEKRRGEINDLIDEHNRLVSLWEQAQEFYSLSQKGELSDTEQLRRTVCKQAMERNDNLNSADADTLRRNLNSLSKRISGMKDNLEKCRQQYEVYCDIRDTYYKISKGDSLSKLVEKERKHREQFKKILKR